MLTHGADINKVSGMARSRKRYKICRAAFPSIQENGMALWCLMKITPQLFEAFLKCPTKCWLKSTGEHGVGNEYAEWVEGQNEAYRGPDYPSALWAGPAPSLQRARKRNTRHQCGRGQRISHCQIGSLELPIVPVRPHR